MRVRLGKKTAICILGILFLAACCVDVLLFPPVVIPRAMSVSKTMPRRAEPAGNDPSVVFQQNANGINDVNTTMYYNNDENDKTPLTNATTTTTTITTTTTTAAAATTTTTTTTTTTFTTTSSSNARMAFPIDIGELHRRYNDFSSSSSNNINDNNNNNNNNITTNNNNKDNNDDNNSTSLTVEGAGHPLNSNAATTSNNKSKPFSSPYLREPNVYPSLLNAHTTSASKSNVVRSNYTVISFHNAPKWFKSSALIHDIRFDLCPVKECYVDVDSQMKSTAVDVLWFFSSRNCSMPIRPPGQIWAFVSWESPQHYKYPEPYSQWKNQFNWTIGYRTDADWFVPVKLLNWRNPKDLLPESEYVNIAKRKTKMAAWWVSHCITSSKRERYVRELQKYIQVDIYGQCGNFSCSQKNIQECEDLLTTTYRFYLSFENSLCRDYVTEKYFRMFAYRTHIIPVVRSGFDYKKYIPGNFTVDASDFKSPKALASYLKDLASEIPRYAKMLQEKDKLIALNKRMDWCDICKRLRKGDYRNGTYKNIREWSHNQAHCRSAHDFHGR